MSEHDLEQALRHALRAVDPGESFADQVLARLDDPVASEEVGAITRPPRGRVAPRWLPLAVAACLVAGVGVVHWREQTLDRQGSQAREQVVQALRIASADLGAARAAMLQAEGSTR